MRKLLAVVVAVAAAMAVTVAGAVWLLTGNHEPQRPQISAYSDGHLVRVGPYRYCEVLNLNSCQDARQQGELAVTGRAPIQLSVPSAIGHAPWRLLRIYEDPRDTSVSTYRPGSRLAVTVATVHPQRGRLTGLVVQLLTLVLDDNGELADVPHAEWSVRAVWPSPR